MQNRFTMSLNTHDERKGFENHLIDSNGILFFVQKADCLLTNLSFVDELQRVFARPECLRASEIDST